MVVRGPNTVYGVFFLILAFFNAAGLLVMLHAEFLAFILLIVYVGAVAVLFLFVVMMLDGERKSHQPLARRSSFASRYIFAVAVLVFVFSIEIGLMVVTWRSSPEALSASLAPPSTLSNTQALGQVLYTHYLLPFQGVGLILLIAMVGTIVLTLRHRNGVRRQQVAQQLERDPRESLRLIDIPYSGQGRRE